jgi:hypothetical protein
MMANERKMASLKGRAKAPSSNIQAPEKFQTTRELQMTKYLTANE